MGKVCEARLIKIQGIKSFIFVLMMVMFFPLTTTAFATNDFTANESKAVKVLIVNNYTVDDVKALEPYVYVENSRFGINADAAMADGFDEALIQEQKQFFEQINKEAAQGKVIIKEDLDFTAFSSDSVYACDVCRAAAARGAEHWYSCGGGRNTAATNHWWGYSRYACNCETQRMAADFSSCASVAAGIGVVGKYFGGIGAIPGGLSSAYWWLLASRLDANNHGRGVYTEMTWVLAFDITSQ
jgi:hypothetical protein